MLTPIQALPTDVIHLMAAGEVIDSLAAVVRELAENALDAGATRIVIQLWTEGWRVSVADNGRGMSLSDLEQAALPHRTSKIQQRADLWQIRSLGFRGEALHSLAQLADLEICSRLKDETEYQAEGYRVAYDAEGEPVHVQPLALAPGSIVTAARLFENWPSRRQSQPLTQQLRGAQQAIQHLALCYPQITWQVEQNDRPWFSIWGSPTAKLVLAQLVRVPPTDIQEVRQEVTLRDFSPEFDPGFDPKFDADYPAALTLTLGLPDRCHRHRPDWVKVAVNGRIVRLPELEQTLLSSLRRALPRERFPVCLLHLKAPPSQIDWNRHPAKTELYLRHLDIWQAQVKQAIDQALQSSLQNSQPLGQLLKLAEAEGVYRTSREIAAPADSSDSSGASLAATPLIPLKAVAQVHGRYILVEHPSGLWLVEQHIAHERVLYEQLCDRWQIVPIEPPLIVGPLSELQQAQLLRLGLEAVPFGERQWAVRSAPETLARRADSVEAILELSLGDDLETALVATACRTAIRNGQPLALPEMQSLIDQWQATRNPRTCPHGRPIYLPLEESSLSRFFRRHWVIGKSHGI